jgi:hypothetical protein
VSWVATASSIVESSARWAVPLTTSVASITARTASTMRSGRAEPRSRVRQ